MTPAPSPAVIASLAHSRHVLNRLRYAQTQLRVLLEANESRFLGRALDELADAEEELEVAEAMTARAANETGMAPGLECDCDRSALVDCVPDDARRALDQLRDTIYDLLTEVNAERAATRALSHALVVDGASGQNRQA